MVENLAYLESLYSQGKTDSSILTPEWREFFSDDLAAGAMNGEHGSTRIHFPVESGDATLNEKLQSLVQNFRTLGHAAAKIDPLGAVRPVPPELSLEFYNFSSEQLGELINLPGLQLETPLAVRDFFERLQKIYSGAFGVEFMHIENAARREWLQHRLENISSASTLSPAERRRVLERLSDAGIFEEFLRKKFIGAKTFSLEGLEMLVPLLDFVLEKSSHHGVRDVVIGMAHRGRLNVLTHIAGKPARDIFREFEGVKSSSQTGHGDVKYHLGHSGDYTTADGKKIHISLCFNPSHLEFVNPIVMGRTRARQDGADDQERNQSLSLLIHGDAAFAGEGIVPETLNLSRLSGYCVGGTVHVILNNQIGFTTSPHEARSTSYATDVARMLQSPIFHVNGENAEAVAQVTRLAMDFQNTFKTDVFVDIYGFRRFGHNETDEPSFTQPVMYREIEKRKTARQIFFDWLEKEKLLTVEEFSKIEGAAHGRLDLELSAARSDQPSQNGASKTLPPGIWKNYAGGAEPADEIETGLAPEKISALLRKLSEMPADFHLHPKLERSLKARREMADGKLPLDWASAELLALASVAEEKIRVRLSGQDCARGTFSHRHAVFYDQEKGFPFSPLQYLAPEQARVEIVNSPLSEAGALGFEYGYSLDCPDGLILWEAQFGDFVNVAQVILDQFITSAEDKWQRLSGLVLLLPHGFEGMGAEHSSARLERFLALAANDNIQVAQPTTPAQYFHLLRRQALRNWRKPLVILTPKSLLRHPQVVSPLAEFSSGSFQRILPDNVAAEKVKRVLLCTGKLFYELAAYREENKRDDVLILRLEQLYPLSENFLEKLLSPLAAKISVFWVQEEPVNMGAWRFLHEKFGKKLLGHGPFEVVCRPESASPATGSAGAHKMEQADLIRRAFGGEPAKKVPPAPTAATAKTQEE